MSGLTLMPRQNDRDHAGDVRGFEVQVSGDGTNWEQIAQGELASSFDPKTIFVLRKPFAQRNRSNFLLSPASG